MNLWPRKYYAQLVFALAGTALVLSIGWYVRRQAAVRILFREATAHPSIGLSYVSVGTLWPQATLASWATPPSQSAGSGWLYEVFTPPDISHNILTGKFALGPADLLAEPGSRQSGLELHTVKLKPYRLQLQGYFGGPGDYHVALVSAEIPGIILVRPGHRIDQLGVTLTRFEVDKMLLEDGDSRPSVDVVAQAVLADEQTGKEVVLDSRGPKYTDTPVAIIKFAGTSGKLQELQEGEIIKDAAVDFRIQRIQLDPPEVALDSILPDPAGRNLRILRPIVHSAPLSAQSGQASLRLTPPTEKTRP